MEFTITKNALQKELGFLQGIVERKNTIPVLANVLLEAGAGNLVRITGTDLDVTLSCETDAVQISKAGAVCVLARKLFDAVRLLPDSEAIYFVVEENNWVTIRCGKWSGRIAGLAREQFPEVAAAKATPLRISSAAFKSLVERTIFAITLEESRYTLSGAKFMLDKSGARMVTTDGHRLAHTARPEVGAGVNGTSLDALIPRKTLSELSKLAASFDGEMEMGADDNHIYFRVGRRLLVSRTLTGQFPNYEMVIPRDSPHTALIDAAELKQAVRRVALMADERTRAVRFRLSPGSLHVSAQTAEEGEAEETVAADYTGEETTFGFNSDYISDALGLVESGQVALDFKSGDSQVLVRPVAKGANDSLCVVMPLRL
jgi:DNA polymerase-3 subunit beta